jgi:hypothetical protein
LKNFLLLQLPFAKIGDEPNWKLILFSAIENCSMDLLNPFYFSFEEDVGFLEPLLFPKCSHKVLNELLTYFSSAQCVPNVTSFCPICFALCFALGTYID